MGYGMVGDRDGTTYGYNKRCTIGIYNGYKTWFFMHSSSTEFVFVFNKIDCQTFNSFYRFPFHLHGVPIPEYMFVHIIFLFSEKFCIFYIMNIYIGCISSFSRLHIVFCCCSFFSGLYNVYGKKGNVPSNKFL